MSRAYTFTIFDLEWICPESHPMIKALVCQPEICPDTHRTHFQGFVRLFKTARIPKVKQILGCPTAHLEVAIGTDQQNIDYCTKSDSRFPDTTPIMWGEFSSQGKRSDLIEIYEKGKDGTLRFDETTLQTVARYPRYFDKCKSLFKGPSFREVKVYWLWGEPGTGKTRTAYSFDPELYSLFSQSPEWWDGYDSEKTILIDEYRGDLPMSRLLKILDGYRLQIPIKGSSAWLLAETIYITSNYPPERFASGVNLRALTRRLTEVKEMARSPPGETDF